MLGPGYKEKEEKKAKRRVFVNINSLLLILDFEHNSKRVRSEEQ